VISPTVTTTDLCEGKREHQTFLKKDLTNFLSYCMHLICC